MPKYPDIVVYIERLESLVCGHPLEQVRFASPFLLRTAEPPIDEVKGRIVQGFKRLGKRIVFIFEKDFFLVLHLMIAGRLQWKKPACKIPGKVGLAAFDFSNGSLLITEAGSIKRASLHLIKGNDQLAGFDPASEEALERSYDPETYTTAEIDWLKLRDEVMRTIDFLYQRYNDGKLNMLEFESKKEELLGRL